MTCDDCQPWLIDLVSGELDPARAKELREHARQCARCGADLRVLEEGLLAADALPRLAPPAGVRDAVLAEAARREQARSGRRAAPTKASKGETGGWFSRLAELCMSPQVAMVAVLLLMISVGLYYLPGPEPESAGLSPLRVQEDALGTGPSDQAASATAFMVEDEAAEAEPELAAEPAPGGGAAPRADGTLAKPRPSRRTQERQAKGAPGAPRRRARAEKKKAKSAPPIDALLGGGSYAPPPPAAEPTAPKPQKRAETLEAYGTGSQANASGSRVASGAAAEAEAMADLEADADDGAPSLAPARRAQAEGQHLRAARLAEAALAQGADALAGHTLAAVSYRRAGRCAQAAPHYRAMRKLRGELPPEWPGAVRCFDALGKDAEVEAWLAEAERRQPAAARRLRDALRSARSKAQSAPATLEAQ